MVYAPHVSRTTNNGMGEPTSEPISKRLNLWETIQMDSQAEQGMKTVLLYFPGYDFPGYANKQIKKQVPNFRGFGFMLLCIRNCRCT